MDHTQGKRSILFLIWLMLLVAYFDRVVIAIAAPDIRASLGLNKSAFGFVLSAFTAGYALLQVPGGHLADRFGAKRLLVMALFVWSAFTGLTGLAWSLVSILSIRLLFGFGEGLENGAQFKLIGDHFDSNERSLASGLFLSALALGPAIATPFASGLLVKFGWRTTFYTFTVPGLLVAALLVAFLPSEASTAPRAKAHRPQIRAAAGPFITYLLFNVAFWGFLSWIPSYLREQRHMSTAAVGLLGTPPYLCGFVGVIVFGFAARRPQVRQVIISACCLGAAGLLYLALAVRNDALCVVALCAAAFFLYGLFGPFWGAAIDRASPETRGVFSGLVNFGGQIGAFTGQIAIGFLADRLRSFNGAIELMVGALVLAGFVACLPPRTPRSLAGGPGDA